MTETPDERRERIDEARRDQAGLHREIGYEYVNLAIRPSAMEAWRNLNHAMAKNEDEGKPRPRCTGKAEAYSDYDAYSLPSPGRAKMMCENCPVIQLCREYGQIARPAWGVYGGEVYGRDLAQKERRELANAERKKMQTE